MTMGQNLAELVHVVHVLVVVEEVNHTEDVLELLTCVGGWISKGSVRVVADLVVEIKQRA